MANEIREELGTYEVKTHLSDILKRVEKGESFTITHRGRAIAELTPARKLKNPDRVKLAIEGILSNQLPPMSDAEFTALLKDGRKY